MKRGRKVVYTTLVSAFIGFSGLSCAKTQLHESSRLEEKVGSLFVAENVLYDVTNKLETFRETKKFDIFYDIEENKNIIGLKYEKHLEDYYRWSSIEIDGKERYNYYNKQCFVVAQLIDNYLESKNMDAYILLVRGKKFEAVFPKDYPEEVVERWGSNGKIKWDYHMANVLEFNGKKYVLDPSHSSKVKLLEDYVKRFENSESLRLNKFKSKEELDRFLHPIKLFKPRVIPLNLEKVIL